MIRKKGFDEHTRPISSIFIISVILVIMTSCENNIEENVGLDEISKDQQDMATCEEVIIDIEKVDYSIINDNNEIIASIYYELPVVKGAKGLDTVNRALENEMNEWFDGAGRMTHYEEGWLDDFKNSVAENREALGDEIISKQPFLYTVDSEVTFVSEKIISIRYIATVQTAGRPGVYYYGCTFDLSSGKLIGINELVNLDVKPYKDMIVSVLLDMMPDYNHNIKDDELLKIYGENREDFLISYDNEIIDMNYEFYWDGTYYFIILNHYALIDKGIMIKWNGILGEEQETQPIGYNRNSDGTYDLVEY